MRGRKPKPERLRLLEGSVRVVGGSEPPQAPDWLDGDARAEWDRIVGELSKKYLVTPLDALSLASYCRVYSMWREADKQVKEQGITFIADNGNIRCNPAAKLALSLFEAMRRMASEFGFTPAARSRLTCEQPATAEEDEFESFLDEGSSKANSEQE
jgi:P27 family predicted phage terminase small subunit